MKTRSLIFILALVLFAILCWWLWRSIQSPHITQQLNLTHLPVPARTPDLTIPGTVTSNGPTPEPKSKEQVMSEKLAILNDQPIDFYGRVVDQHGVPVVGAKVRGGVMVDKIWMGGKFVDHYTTTDMAGNFAFRGLRGAEIVIQPMKEGYEYKADNNRNFYYSLLHRENERHHPKSDTPEVFTMWKLHGAESLISGDKFFGIKADGTPFTIDLVKGRKMEGRKVSGNLVVTIVQPSQIISGQKFDWSFNVEAIDGGLVEAKGAQYMNEAPAQGYQTQISKELKATDPEWSEVVRKTFFVKSGNQFARVIAEIHANYQGAGVFSIQYLVNRKPGSRNLEHDSDKN